MTLKLEQPLASFLEGAHETLLAVFLDIFLPECASSNSVEFEFAEIFCTDHKCGIADFWKQYRCCGWYSGVFQPGGPVSD